MSFSSFSMAMLLVSFIASTAMAQSFSCASLFAPTEYAKESKTTAGYPSVAQFPSAADPRTVLASLQPVDAGNPNLALANVMRYSPRYDATYYNQFPVSFPVDLRAAKMNLDVDRLHLSADVDGGRNQITHRIDFAGLASGYSVRAKYAEVYSFGRAGKKQVDGVEVDAFNEVWTLTRSKDGRSVKFVRALNGVDARPRFLDFDPNTIRGEIVDFGMIFDGGDSIQSKRGSIVVRFFVFPSMTTIRYTFERDETGVIIQREGAPVVEHLSGLPPEYLSGHRTVKGPLTEALTYARDIR